MKTGTRGGAFISQFSGPGEGEILCFKFWKLAVAMGCPYRCGYCFLQTVPFFTFNPDALSGLVYTNVDDMVSEVQKFLLTSEPKSLVAGELQDGLVFDPAYKKITGIALTHHLVPLFAAQDRHQLLFLTKSTQIEHLAELQPTKQVVVTWSVNAPSVAAMCEHGAPTPFERLDAAATMKAKGWRVRLRLDPMVPVPDWQDSYGQIIERINQLEPEMVTIGALRATSPKSLRTHAEKNGRGTEIFNYLTEERDASGFKYRIPFDKQIEMFRFAIDHLKSPIAPALCKEDRTVWDALSLPFRGCHCLLDANDPLVPAAKVEHGEGGTVDSGSQGPQANASDKRVEAPPQEMGLVPLRAAGRVLALLASSDSSAGVSSVMPDESVGGEGTTNSQAGSGGFDYVDGECRTDSSDEQSPDESPPEEGEEPPSEPPFLTALEISRRTPQGVKWVVEGLLGQGAITLLEGPPKSAGKSTLVGYLAKAVLRGESFLELNTTQTGIAIISEERPTTFRRQLDRTGLAARKDLHVVFHQDISQLTWSEVVTLGANKCHSSGASVLVIDTLAAFTQGAEASSAKALEIMQPLQEAASNGLAVLVIRHTRKSGGEVGVSGRGSSAFTGAADIVLSLARPPKYVGSKRILEALSRFDETPPLVQIELGPDGYIVTDSPDLPKVTIDEALLAVAPNNEHEAIPAEGFVALSGLKKSAVHEALTRLVFNGALQQKGRGVRGDPRLYWRSPIV